MSGALYPILPRSISPIYQADLAAGRLGEDYCRIRAWRADVPSPIEALKGTLPTYVPTYLPSFRLLGCSWEIVSVHKKPGRKRLETGQF